MTLPQKRLPAPAWVLVEITPTPRNAAPIRNLLPIRSANNIASCEPSRSMNTIGRSLRLTPCLSGLRDLRQVTTPFAERRARPLCG